MKSTATAYKVYKDSHKQGEDLGKLLDFLTLTTEDWETIGSLASQIPETFGEDYEMEGSGSSDIEGMEGSGSSETEDMEGPDPSQLEILSENGIEEP